MPVRSAVLSPRTTRGAFRLSPPSARAHTPTARPPTPPPHRQTLPAAAAALKRTAMPPMRSFSTVNFYAGSELNRLSWLREDDAFLNRALHAPGTQVVLLNRSHPLVHASGPDEGRLATLPYAAVARAVDPEGQGEVFGARANGMGGGKATHGLVPEGIALVLLGMKEETTTLPGREPKGTPYFALSLSYAPVGGDTPGAVRALRQALEEDERYAFGDARAIAMRGVWPASEAAIVAQASSMLDWNTRNKFCPACGAAQYSQWAGYKRGCTTALAGETGCASTTSVQNFSHPRTDPVTIMAAISADGEKILLGRKKDWPPGFYSCLAGFVEPGESVEDAVRREVEEEAGVKVDEVVYHSSQPWPFPANLMIGAFAQVRPGQAVRLDLDNELEDARFVPRDEVLAVLARQGKKDGRGGPGAGPDKRGAAASVLPQDVRVRIPGPAALAHTLIVAWARREAFVPPVSGTSKL